MQINIIEKSVNYDELPRLIFLLALTIIAVLASVLDILLPYAILICLGFFLFCSSKIYYYQSVSKWSKTKAVITDYKLVCLKKTDCESKASICNYTVQIDYEYNHKDKVYKSNKVALDKNVYCFGENKNTAIEYLETFLNQSMLYVYINPKKEHESVLEMRMSGQTLFNCTLCIGISIVLSSYFISNIILASS